MSREYPEVIAGPYESPPVGFEDDDGREIVVERYDGDVEEMVGMYLDFDPADRAQGIPPTNERRIREWLEALLVDDCVNVVARHDGRAIGHATLVPDREEAHELAIFVLEEYQNAGIGTRLLETLLGAGYEAGVEYVWLSVERWNTPAVALYRKVGFEPSETGGFELEMAARLS